MNNFQAAFFYEVMVTSQVTSFLEVMQTPLFETETKVSTLREFPFFFVNVSSVLKTTNLTKSKKFKKRSETTFSTELF